MVTHLRPEARPANWKDLDGTQQRAFIKIVKMVGEAIDELDESGGRGTDDSTAWPSSTRKSRRVFLSGGRGAGKTPLLASLIDQNRTGDESIAGDEEFRRALQSVRRRVVWLEPIDMEAMAPTANLLSAILARVED